MDGKKISLTRGITKITSREINRLQQANTRFTPAITPGTGPGPDLLLQHEGGPAW